MIHVRDDRDISNVICLHKYESGDGKGLKQRMDQSAARNGGSENGDEISGRGCPRIPRTCRRIHKTEAIFKLTVAKIAALLAAWSSDWLSLFVVLF